MDIKKLLEKMDQFAGQAVGQKPGDQWKGTDKAPPGKKLVGDSILKDLSKGKKGKSKEQELSEEFQAFLEAEFQDTVDKRPARKNARPARGHEPKSGYKTIKADEGWAQGSDRVSLPDEPYTYWNGTGKLQKEYDALYAELVPSQGAADTIEGEVLRAASKIVYRHYNDGDEFNKASFDQLKAYIGTVTSYDDLAHKATEYALKANGNYHPNAGWDSLDVMDYGPTDDDEEDEDDWYDDEDEDDLEEAKKAQKQQGKVEEGQNGGFYIVAHRRTDGRSAVVKKDGQEQYFDTKEEAGARVEELNARTTSPHVYYTIGQDFNEGWESGPEEYQEPYDDADDAYDRQRQEKIDTEAEREWAKLPKVSTYKLSGRGPNMEPNYEFGDEFDSMEKALEYRKQIMADPKTPYPEHIGIRTITRVVNKDQTNENSVTTPKNPEHAKQMMKDLSKMQTDVPNPDPELAATIARRKEILMKQAKDLGIDESRAHKVLDTWFKNRERQEKFARGELTVPTPQERNAKIEKPKAKKQVKELMATPPQGTATQTMQQKTQAQDPKQAQAVAQATQAMKSATGSTAPATTLAKALDTASQGKPIAGQEASALQPLMKDMATVAQDPKLAGSFKSLVNQINQTQLKQK